MVSAAATEVRNFMAIQAGRSSGQCCTGVIRRPSIPSPAKRGPIERAFRRLADRLDSRTPRQ
jgi:hypothetical protein